jgi:hypothetical protein
MDVHAGNRAFHGTQDVAIIKRRKTTRESALNADFFSAEFPRLDCFISDLLWFEKVSVRFARTTAERAKLATYKTDIRKVDVAINDVSNDVPGEFGAQEVAGNKETKEVVSLSIGQKKALLTTERRALLRLQYLLNRAADGSCHAWRDICPVESRKVSQFHLCAGS